MPQEDAFTDAPDFSFVSIGKARLNFHFGCRLKTSFRCVYFVFQFNRYYGPRDKGGGHCHLDWQSTQGGRKKCQMSWHALSFSNILKTI